MSCIDDDDAKSQAEFQGGLGRQRLRIWGAISLESRICSRQITERRG